MKKKKKKVQSTQKVAVLRSIKPYWLYLILIGKKLCEVGKSQPQDENWDRRVFSYCSMDMRSFRRIPKQDQEWMRQYLGKVACMFICNEIEEYQQYSLNLNNSVDKSIVNGLLERSQLTFRELQEYTINQGAFDSIFAWQISGMVQHGFPMELNEFRKPCTVGVCECCEHKIAEEGNSEYKCGNIITRPPQTYCYVEVA